MLIAPHLASLSEGEEGWGLKSEMDTNYIRIFDTTLRDGEQSPGASLTSAEKLEIARQLARLGVDIIEAGFPAASPDDLEAVARIAQEVGNPTEAHPRVPVIAGLARANKADIDKCWEAVQHASHPRIHTFLATSDIHLKYKLKMTREEVVERVREMVGYARSLCEDVEFSPEDAGRSDPEYLCDVLEVAIKAGATTLNIPDTVGYTTPEEFGALIDGLIKNTRGAEGVTWSVHCHDDLGMATANTLAGLRAGARQCEVTVNGIGERAGNTSLEEVVMTLYTRPAVFDLRTGIDSTQIALDLADGVELHEHPGAAEQGNCRSERLRARGGHSPRRNAQEPDDVRNYATRDGRAFIVAFGLGQTLWPPCLQNATQ